MTDNTARPASGGGDPIQLDDFQRQCVGVFVNAVASLSIPRSIGEIYGLLFSTQEPVSLDDLTERLRMSRGSAHEGLRWLRSIGAVKVVYVPGVRKAHFAAETSLGHLAAGYLRDRIEPHIHNGQDRLLQLRRTVGSADRGAGDAFQRARFAQLTNWYKFLKHALPAVKTLAGKF